MQSDSVHALITLLPTQFSKDCWEWAKFGGKPRGVILLEEMSHKENRTLWTLSVNNKVDKNPFYILPVNPEWTFTELKLYHMAWVIIRFRVPAHSPHRPLLPLHSHTLLPQRTNKLLICSEMFTVVGPLDKTQNRTYILHKILRFMAAYKASKYVCK